MAAFLARMDLAVTFFAGAFLLAAFLAGAFLAGAFRAGAFLADAFLVAVFLKAGQHLMAAVLHSGFTAEPIDKTLQVLFAALLFRATPKDFIDMVRARPQPAPT